MLSNKPKLENILYNGIIVVNRGITIVINKNVFIAFLPLNSNLESEYAVITQQGIPNVNVIPTAFKEFINAVKKFHVDLYLLKVIFYNYQISIELEKS